MSFHSLGTVVLVSALCAGLVTFTLRPSSPIGSAKPETAMERIARTRTVRCAYLVAPPQLIRDPNTGAFSGIGPDIWAEIAKRLDLRIEWTEEVTFVTMPEGLKKGRYDAFCLSSYRWPPSMTEVAYTSPIFYSVTGVYARAGSAIAKETDPQKLNRPDLTVASIDGEASSFIQQSLFPQTKAISLPQSSDLSLALESVADGKADMTFANPLMIMPYMMTHADKVVKLDTPAIGMHSHGFGVSQNELAWRQTVDSVVQDMLADGTIDKILNRYETVPGSLVRTASPLRR